MKNNFKENLTTLFKSTTNTKILFERRKNSLLFPLIITLLILFMMCVPRYLFSLNANKENIIKSFPKISEPMEALLTNSLDCKVKNQALVCSKDAKQINMVVGDDIKYTVIANAKSISIDTNVSYESKKDTDNIIILLKNYIKIRYIERDYVNEKVKTYEILGDYSKFEGYDFKEISQKLASHPELAEKEASNFVHNAYLSTLDTQFLVNLSSSITSLLLFIFVSSIILKSPNLLKIKKGFKFIDCLKISITASLPSLIVSTLLYFLTGTDFTLLFGLIYVIRILYIYFKYIFSTKNSIFKELYIQTNEERFNV